MAFKTETINYGKELVTYMYVYYIVFINICIVNGAFHEVDKRNNVVHIFIFQNLNF